MGFEKIRESDDWVSQVLAKHGLPPTASLEQIEPVAIELLSDISTRLEGIEMVLNRRVDAKELDLSVNGLLARIHLFLSGGEAFAALLLYLETEKLGG